MTGGVNRIVQDAGPQQTVDAENVWATDGSLARRPAWRSIRSSGPHLNPAGQSRVVTETSLGVQATDAERNPTLDNTVAVLYINNEWEAFDGFQLPEDLTLTGTFTGHRRLEVSFWNGAAWSVLPWILDESKALQDDFLQPLSLAGGRVSWHRSHTTTWAAHTLNGITAYWVRVRFLLLDGTVSTLEGSRALGGPGIVTFRLEPVNGLFAVRANRQPLLVICSDANPSRVGATQGRYRGFFEMGAQVATVLEAGPCKLSLLPVDELVGVYDEVDTPDWSGGTATVGAAGVFTKLLLQYYDQDAGVNRNYLWLANQFLGALLTQDNTGGGSSTAVTGVLPDGLSALEQFKHLRLRCNQSAGNPTEPAVGEEREVVWSNLSGLHVRPALSALPGSATFDLRTPPAQMVPEPNRERYEIYSNAAQTVTLSLEPWCRNDAATRLDQFKDKVTFVQEPRWVLPAGPAYSGTVDTVTRQFLMFNGGRLLAHDGRFLRPIRPDTSSVLAQTYVGKLADELDVDANEASVNPLSKLRRDVPQGRYVVCYQNRIVIAGIPSQPLSVVWSAPGALNSIWPLIFETQIRDAEQDPITGLAVLGDKLVVYTQTSIHEASRADDLGRFSFQPACTAVGFVGQQAVVTAPIGGQNVLVGIAPSGVYAWVGGEPVALMDRWDRLLPRGVNTGKLHEAVATVSKQRGIILFAVPSAGSAINDRILVYDYLRKAWWVWTHPFGVSSLATDLVDGQEKILCGTVDGFVSVLVNDLNEDSEVITGRAVTPPSQPGGDQMIQVNQIRVTAKQLGGQQQLTLSLLRNEERPAIQSFNPYPAGPGITWGAGADWGEADARMVTGTQVIEVNASASRLHRVQVEVQGTARWMVRSIALDVVVKERRGRA